MVPDSVDDAGIVGGASCAILTVKVVTGMRIGFRQDQVRTE